MSDPRQFELAQEKLRKIDAACTRYRDGSRSAVAVVVDVQLILKGGMKSLLK